MLTSIRHQTKTRRLRGLTIQLSQTSLPSLIRITAGVAVYYSCGSIKNHVRHCAHRRDGSRSVHVESSIASLRSSLWPPAGISSRYSRGQAPRAGQRVCVAMAVSLTNHPERPKCWLMADSECRLFLYGTSTAFTVRPGSFMGVSSLAFEFGGPLARLLQIDTCYFVKRPAVANLPEGAVQVCARNLVKGPAAGELLGGGDHALTFDLQLILQTVLVLLTSPHGDRPHLFQGTWNPRLLFLAPVALVMGSLSRSFRGWRMLLRSLEAMPSSWLRSRVACSIFSLLFMAVFWLYLVLHSGFQLLQAAFGEPTDGWSGALLFIKARRLRSNADGLRSVVESSSGSGGARGQWA